tara:strand:- start:6896 stop:10174 length:3279 start_codon:yes stop_codon:yes gene_type:complete
MVAIEILQKKWRDLIHFKRDVYSEFNLFRDALLSIIGNIELNKKIYSKDVYKKAMNSIHDTCEKITKLMPPDLNIYDFVKISKFKLYKTLADVKLSTIVITNLIGCVTVDQAISIFLDNHVAKPDQIQTLAYLNIYFNIIKVESYKSPSKNNIKFVLNTFGKKATSNTINLTSYQLDKISINNYSSLGNNIGLKVLGARIYIPFEDSLVVLTGYLRPDHINSFVFSRTHEKKYSELRKMFSMLDIVGEFKNNYLKYITSKDFLVLSVNQICSNCLSDYDEIMIFKNKVVSKIVKQFLLSTLVKKRMYIKSLILDSSDDNSGYMANMLSDLLVHNGELHEILATYRWDIKRRLHYNKHLIKKKTEELMTYDKIPYDKKIHLLRADNKVKEKALTKLKEISNGKSGESNTKASQYLDGLLNIPFGVFKKEYIRVKMRQTIDMLDTIINSTKENITKLEIQYTLNDADLFITADLLSTISDPISNPMAIYTLKLELEKWLTAKTSIRAYFQPAQTNKITRFSKKELLPLYTILDNTSATKKNLVNALVTAEIDVDTFILITKYIPHSSKIVCLFLIASFIKVRQDVIDMIRVADSYLNVQADYFNTIDKTLDAAVFGMDPAKLQIKRLLAQWLSGEDDGYIFGLEGPPGTGKTTLAKQGIAKCLQDELGHTRPFIFIALGGSSNGSTLEGHSYTYVGSTWGSIADGLMTSQCMNPIIYIDELDKISRTEHGKELVGILTHLTDKSQNMAFTDKYFAGIDIDLSKCLIIFSYNDPQLVDPILLDRIQRINIEPLGTTQKLVVAQKYLIPDILKNIGYNVSDITISDDIIDFIISTYTYEAGVRKLKEKLYEVYRSVNLNILERTMVPPVVITTAYVQELFIDYPKHENTTISSIPQIGTINGLFATAAGVGGITLIETSKYYTTTHLELKLTGQQGDVMQESMKVAKSLALKIIKPSIRDKIIKSKEKFGIHIHCPAGGTKKDGPSAGTAITVAIISLLCTLPILNTVATTGEINLNGDVLPIGGLHSKMSGGKKAQATLILCPQKNIDSLTKIRRTNPEIETDKFKVMTISKISDALKQLIIFPKNKTYSDYFAF